MTSSVLLIRFAIFRSLDVYSSYSVNIVLSLRPSPVRSKSWARGEGYLSTTVGSAVWYYCRHHNCLFDHELSPPLSAVGEPIVPLCSRSKSLRFVLRCNTANTMAKSATCWSVSDLSMACHWYNSFCLPLGCCGSTCQPASNTSPQSLRVFILEVLHTATHNKTEQCSPLIWKCKKTMDGYFFSAKTNYRCQNFIYKLTCNQDTWWPPFL